LKEKAEEGASPDVERGMKRKVRLVQRIAYSLARTK
jgi:hypothetical protein